MTPDAMADEPEEPLMAAVKSGDQAAWQQLIDHYEGRLQAFARSRLGSVQTAEDVVQDTFNGFFTSLEHYDSRRTPVESWLFRICENRIKDQLRRQGRRPLAAQAGQGESPDDPLARLTGGRVASSIALSVERKHGEEVAICSAVSQAIRRWKSRGDWRKLRCIELLFVAGAANREVADKTGLSEQQVANYKSEFLGKLKSALATHDRDDNLPDG